jgi:DNA polymerase II large subunit
LKELGYVNVFTGRPLEREDQILEIFPHDVVLPACPESPDEPADEVFFRVGKFIDDELEYLYGKERIFKAEKPSDMVGALLGCIAPHNCAAVVGRLIGFSKTQALLASPYMHAAMRRDVMGRGCGYAYLWIAS